MESAYFDRISDNQQAVLLVEGIQKDFSLPISSLPTGSKPGEWFLIDIQNETITSVEIDVQKTKQLENEIQQKLSRLQSKKNSRFKRR